jgi:hypothetical protein
MMASVTSGDGKMDLMSEEMRDQYWERLEMVTSIQEAMKIRDEMDDYCLHLMKQAGQDTTIMEQQMTLTRSIQAMKIEKTKVEIPVFLRNEGNLVNDSGSVSERNPTIICRPRKG